MKHIQNIKIVNNNIKKKTKVIFSSKMVTLKSSNWKILWWIVSRSLPGEYSFHTRLSKDTALLIVYTDTKNHLCPDTERALSMTSWRKSAMLTFTNIHSTVLSELIVTPQWHVDRRVMRLYSNGHFKQGSHLMETMELSRISIKIARDTSRLLKNI